MSWYCSFSLVFQCATGLSLIFSCNIDIDCLGELKKTFYSNKGVEFCLYVNKKYKLFWQNWNLGIEWKNVFKSYFQHSKGSGRSIYLIWEYIRGSGTCLGPFFQSFSAKKGNFPCLVWLHQNFKSWFNVILEGQRCLELIFII